MENRQFDQLARGLTSGASRRRILGGLAAALVGGAALATGGDAARKRVKAQKQDKVLICHNPETADQEEKELPAKAAQAHLRHGDTPGPCPTSCGTDFCQQDEECIGGGEIPESPFSPFPLVCCPEQQVCGGPEADVQICCPSGTECVGTIPNQFCAPVAGTRS
jgi:hypothetical protein